MNEKASSMVQLPSDDVLADVIVFGQVEQLPDLSGSLGAETTRDSGISQAWEETRRKWNDRIGSILEPRNKSMASNWKRSRNNSWGFHPVSNLEYQPLPSWWWWGEGRKDWHRRCNLWRSFCDADQCGEDGNKSVEPRAKDEHDHWSTLLASWGNLKIEGKSCETVLTCWWLSGSLLHTTGTKKIKASQGHQEIISLGQRPIFNSYRTSTNRNNKIAQILTIFHDALWE